MEKSFEKEDSRFGMADSVTAKVVRGGKVLDNKKDESENQKESEQWAE